MKRWASEKGGRRVNDKREGGEGVKGRRRDEERS